MTPSKVPSSQIGRLFHYGGLAAGIGLGAINEGFRRATSSSDSSQSSLMFSASNMERLVRKLSRMRGAALKLGQMISIQGIYLMYLFPDNIFILVLDSNLLPQPIHDVLLRVQDSADYMPHRQMQEVMTKEFGAQWRDMFLEFNDVPMAAASIGQVHAARMKDGQAVAVKIQYPGIAESIDSDLNNLSLLLTASRLLPKGLYLDKTIEVARMELGWECDYAREAECIRTFGKLLEGDPNYTVPKVIDQATGRNVITMERMWGIPIGKRAREFTPEVRDWLGTQILRLCLRELKDFKYMQTDPNWTNFLYNPKTKKVYTSVMNLIEARITGLRCN
jgi:aarF domain-containing kinase